MLLFFIHFLYSSIPNIENTPNLPKVSDLTSAHDNFFTEA